MPLTNQLLLHLMRQRQRAFSKNNQQIGEQSVPTITPTPIKTIKDTNRLFGSVRVENRRIENTQIPSWYYMDNSGKFVRLRPLHSSGFKIMPKDTRTVALYVGDSTDWDSSEDLNGNISNNAALKFVVLGNNRTDIIQKFNELKTHTIRTDEFNPASVTLNQTNIYFINQGDLEGMFAAYSTHTNKWELMKVFDTSNPTSTRARAHHWGHTAIDGYRLTDYYNNHLPGVLEKLELLGKRSQFARGIKLQSGTSDFLDMKYGVSMNMPVLAEVSYFDKVYDIREEELSMQVMYMCVVNMIDGFV